MFYLHCSKAGTILAPDGQKWPDVFRRAGLILVIEGNKNGLGDYINARRFVPSKLLDKTCFIQEVPSGKCEDSQATSWKIKIIDFEMKMIVSEF